MEFPDLPGCITEGNTVADAIFMAEDAASGWVLTDLEDGKSAPKASDPGSIEAPDGGFALYHFSVDNSFIDYID